MADLNEALTDREREILHFESLSWKQRGAKESEIRSRFRLTPVRYYRALNRLIDREAALEHDPALVNRLRRLRDEGAERRLNVRSL